MPWEIIPDDTDFLPEPVIIKENGTFSNAQDEYLFSADGVIIRINCGRRFEIDVPLGYTEAQVKRIAEYLPRMSEADMDRHSKRAVAASGKLKDYHIPGQVELNFLDFIKFHWSDGTSSTVPRSVMASSDESEDPEAGTIDIPYIEE